MTTDVSTLAANDVETRIDAADGDTPTRAISRAFLTHNIDRAAQQLRRRLVEVLVGFKWFVDGFWTGALGFAGEESAGASFLRRHGQVRTSDKDGIAKLSAADVPGDVLAGESIIEKLTHPPGNAAPLGGLKVTTANGWCAARPSGTEDVDKIYAVRTNHE